MTPLARLLAAAALAALAFPLAFPAAAQPVDTLGRIKAAKAINVAFAGDSMPFAHVGREQRPEGYAIDLCGKVIAGIARAVGEPDLKVNWRIGTTAERLAMVADGRAELECGNTTPTLGRMKSVDFGALVFVDAGGVLVRRDGGIADLRGLAGKRVAVIAGTTTEQRLAAALKERRIAAEVIRVREAAEGMALLAARSADAFASDKVKLVGAAVQTNNPQAWVVLDDILSFEPYAFAVPRNDTAFRAEVNRALAQAYAGGDLDAIYKRWFSAFGAPSQLLVHMYLLNAVQE